MTSNEPQYLPEKHLRSHALFRGAKRFPETFRFQLTREELNELVTNCDNPDRLRFAPSLPFAFTEQVVSMLSGILRSKVAITASIRIMNTFVAVRRTLASLGPLLRRIEETERRQLGSWQTSPITKSVLNRFSGQ